MQEESKGKGICRRMKEGFTRIGSRVISFFVGLPSRTKAKFAGAKEIITQGNGKVAASCLIMGLGQLLYRQWAKGILYLLTEAAFVLFFVFIGAEGIVGLFTLGTVEGNAWYGIEGDNSVILLIVGILSVIALAFYVILYFSNIKDVYRIQCAYDTLKEPESFKKQVASLLDKNFHKTALALPIIGVSVFSILPILFMILIAFTNYGGTIVPPKLISWVGLENFAKILTLSDFAPTFFKIFGWNILWAVLSTFINYFAGLALALLFNNKCVKG